MPRYPYNRLETWTWLEGPDGKKSQGPRPDLLWLHDVKSGPRLTMVQIQARIFLQWADSRFPAFYPAALLTAGVASPDALTREVRRVGAALLACCPPMTWAEHCEAMKRPPKDSKSPVLLLSRLLNGVMNLGPLIYSGDDRALFGDVDDDSDRDIDPFTQSYIRFSAPNAGATIRAALKHLRNSSRRPAMRPADTGDPLPEDAEFVQHRDAVSRRAWHTSLEEAMRLAVDELHAVVVADRFHIAVSGTKAAQRDFTAAFRYVCQMARSGRTFRASHWMKAATSLRDKALVWMQTEITHHVKSNQQTSKKITLNRAISFVVQYATLMQGSSRISTAVTPIRYLRDICAAIVGLDGPVPVDEDKVARATDHDRVAEVLAGMDRRVLSDGVFSGWRNVLDNDGDVIGQFIAEVATPKPPKAPQSVRWAKGEHIETLKKLWPTGTRITKGSLDDVFLNRCMVPLQMLGLAAQLPDDLWGRAKKLETAEREGLDVRGVKTLARYRGTKWIVNPLGAALAFATDHAGA